MGFSDEFGQYDAQDLAALVASGEVSPLELVDATIERIERVNPELNFVAASCFEHARDVAAKGKVDGPFGGVPYFHKDLFNSWSGVPNTHGNVCYKDHIPDFDSIMNERVKSAGFILVATTTTPDFGWALCTETAAHGITRNPWNTGHTPGGSSGGAAAAVASRAFPLANASDGGGSTRVPASYCGLVGLKPTRGLIPWGPDFIESIYGGGMEGCLSISVRDTAAFLDVVAGSPPCDAYYVPERKTSFTEALSVPPAGLRIGVILQSPDGAEPISSEVLDGVRSAAQLCESLGHHVEETTLDYDVLPTFMAYRRIMSVIHAAGVAATKEMLERDIRDSDFVQFMHSSAAEGDSISAVEHAADIDAMRQGARQIGVSTEPYDVVICPTIMNPAPEIGFLHPDETPFEEYWDALIARMMTFASPFNISGQPGLSLPLHMSSEGLPIGVQFVGSKLNSDDLLLSLAAQIEEAAPWANRIPPVHA